MKLNGTLDVKKYIYIYIYISRAVVLNIQKSCGLYFRRQSDSLCSELENTAVSFGEDDGLSDL